MLQNFQKANCTKFSENLDWYFIAIPLHNITVNEGCEHFCRAIYKAIYTAIPQATSFFLNDEAYKTWGNPEYGRTSHRISNHSWKKKGGD